MTDAPPPSVPGQTPEPDVAPTPAPEPPLDGGAIGEPDTEGSSRRAAGRALRAARALGRVGRAIFVLGVALVAAAIVAGLSIDLGPSLRARAEAAGSRQINRPLHIGRLSVRLLTGDFVVEDLRIEGLSPTDRPFFSGKSVVLDIPWWSVVRRDLLIRSVELTDWHMLVETFPGGRHNFPRLTSGGPRTGPRLITTTVQFVRAASGSFTYEDRDGSSWSVVAPNIDITVNKLTDYRGHVSFSDGTVRILSYLPMQASMKTGFRIDRGHITFDDMTLSTDGAESTVDGDVDMGNWPEQTHRVASVVQFPRMREIFWPGQSFSLGGEGTFDGTFHLFKGGHELQGTFASRQAGFNALRFDELAGALRWTSDRVAVSDTRAGFYGGRLALGYLMSNLGQPTPGRASFTADYEGVELTSLTEALEFDGLRLAGHATGRNVLNWELGNFAKKEGEGTVSIVPPNGTWLVARDIADTTLASLSRERPLPASFDRTPFRAPLPIGGELRYRYSPEWIDIEPSSMATARTFVSFAGRTAYGERSTIPFQVISGDWQESDRVLAAIMTVVGARTNAIPIGGYGRFAGVMLNDFRRPRIEGMFTGQDMVAWDVVWGDIDARLTVENSYADIEDGVVRSGDSRIDASGRFSLGYPRADGGEQIDSRIRVSKRPVVDLRHAFELDDYDFNGTLSGEFHVYGDYQGPLGFGRVVVENGIAYGETFDAVESGVRLEGKGIRLDSIEARKATGEITGVAYVGFDGSYSFESSARRIPVESLKLLEGTTGVPLTGVLRFSAFGNGVFDAPRYEVRGALDDLFLGDEGIGQVTGRLGVRGDVVTIEQLDVASPRLSASGTGRIDFSTRSDADLTFRFLDASLDPYARVYQPRLSPFTTAVASGTLRVTGDLQNTSALRATAVVEQLDLRLFDYRLRNDGPLRLSVAQGIARIEQLGLIGEGTKLEIAGNARLSDERLDITASGDANLGILQGLLRDIRSTGEARLRATLGGTVSAPTVNGSLSVVGGRIRHFALPHSIEDLNGAIEFNAGGASFEGLSGRLGGGEVDFGGSVLFAGAFPDEFGLTAVGRGLRLRYPEGFRSVIDADLALRGKVDAPVLSGSVVVKDALWVKTFDPSGAGMFSFSPTAPASTAGPGAPAEEPRFPVRFDIRLDAPSTLRIENSSTRLVSSASLTLAGTYDRPVLFGRADIDRGDILFEGHRYVVTRGAIDFANPTRIEPIFDIEAETRTRIPGETYRVTFRVSGTAERLGFQLTSDPPLPVVDILALLFGDTRSTEDVELRALRTPELIESDLVMSRAARLLASPLSSGVGRVVEQALGVDAVQISPSLGDITSLQASRLNPGARLTLSKRISSRLLLTLSRTLTASTPEQVILLEYNQNDRLSWILTQNEDRTYAVDVRVRRVF